MPDPLEYITKDALIMCDKGAAPQTFVPLHNLKVKVHGCLAATEIDKIPFVNIPSFLICKTTQKPCVPAPLMLKDTFDVKVKGANSVVGRTLVGRCSINCPVGQGKIEFMTSGQVPLPEDAEQELLEMQRKGKQLLDDSGYGDSVGETGFVEGMVPVWGRGRDMINDIQTGDGWGTVINGGFLIWDVASIVAGAFTFGGGTAVMQGIKAGAKGATKAVAKAISKEALQKLGKEGFEYLSKEILEKKIKDNALKLYCKIVKGCFPAGTLVHCEHGLIPIEKVKVGDVVKAYNESTGEIGYKRVLEVSCIEGNETLVELHLNDEIIKCTPNHPFWVEDTWKDAEQIGIGESLKTSTSETVRVIEKKFYDNNENVYNFEVEDWNTYFVGEAGVLVHNVCLVKTLDEAIKTTKGWRDWTTESRRLLRLAVKGKKGDRMEAHHLIPLELMKKNPYIRQAFKDGFDYNGLINGRLLEVAEHTVTNGKRIYSHPAYTRVAEDVIEDMIKRNPKLSNVEVLNKVTDQLDEFVDEALEYGMSIDEWAKFNGY